MHKMQKTTLDTPRYLALFLDLQGKVLYANSPLAGFALENLAGQNLLDSIPSDHRDELMRSIQSASSGGRKHSFEIPIISATGLTSWWHCRIGPVKRSGQIEEFLLIGRNITERKKEEERLDQRTELETLRLLVDNSPLGMAWLGNNGHYKYRNPRFSELLGFTGEDIPDNPDWNALPYPDAEDNDQTFDVWIRELREGGAGPAGVRAFAVKPEGRSARIVRFLAFKMDDGDLLLFSEDVTEIEQKAEQVEQIKNLESIGSLAGALAHDFNNLLTVIQGRTSLMLLDTDVSHPQYAHLKEINSVAANATRMINLLRAFAGQGSYNRKAADPNSLIEKTTRAFARNKTELNFRLALEEKIWAVEVDQTKFEQVLFNLYQNAWEAMPSAGDLYVSSENIRFDERQSKPYGLAKENYVRISIKDTGRGMDQKIRRRIFEPFFSTKDPQKNKGLGLSTAFGIIKRLGGAIRVASTEGQGTSVVLYLPAAAGNVEHSIAAEKRIPEGQIVLVADSNQMSLHAAGELLAELDYEVLAAKSGEECIDTFGDNQDRIELVILDMQWPDTTAAELYADLRHINPAVKVIICSTRPVDRRAVDLLRQGCEGFVQKPFDRAALLEALRENRPNA